MEMEQYFNDKFKDLKDDIQAIDDKADKTHKILSGNGEVGLCEEVRTLKKNYNRLTARWSLVVSLGMAVLLKVIF